MFPGKGYNETRVGDSSSTSMTVTETHLVLAAGMFGDFNPLHVNETHAAKSRLGGRVLHGGFTSALMAAVRTQLNEKVELEQRQKQRRWFLLAL